MTNSHVAELRDVTLQFEDKLVLDDLSLKIQPQDRLVIMGQSGAGKSTILRLILGILYPYSALLSSLTVRDNVALPLEETTDKKRQQIDQIVDEKLELVGLKETRNLMPSELSGGMRKRVSLARALVLEPELILFDEPVAGLDPVMASVIDELIISLSEKSKVTCVVVTHEMDSAFRIATRMAMLYHGKIIEEGTPEEMKKSHNPVVSQFLTGSTEGPILEETKDAITA